MESKTGWFGSFGPTSARLSEEGELVIQTRRGQHHTLTRDLRTPDSKVDIAPGRSDKPFCIKFEIPGCEEIVIDTCRAEEHQRWVVALQHVCGSAVASSKNTHRQYNFSVSLGGDVLKRFTVRHSSAKLVHKQLKKA